MKKSISKQTTELLKKHTRKQRWLRIVTGLSCVAVFCTTYALILPAITMSTDVFCGYEEHIAHTEECYSTVKICGYGEADDQTGDKVLVCGMEEGELPAPELICTETEHVHGDGCYTVVSETRVCTAEEHTHGDGCYTTTEELVCTAEEHTHGEACYDEEGNLICERSEHTHDSSCYETVTVLTCELPEHTHDSSCYETETALTCELPEHTHNDSCYAEVTTEAHIHTDACYHVHTEECFEKTLTCELPIHEHTTICFADPDSVETAAEWEASMSGVELTGVWADDLVAIAESQLGYRESTVNYEVLEDGSEKGYTRYGAWYGIPYGDWCAMFVSFCLSYADISRDDVPYDASCPNWTRTLSSEEWDMFRSAEDYFPVKGDIIFFDYEQNSSADHVGIVAEVEEVENLETGVCEYVVKTIEGNTSDSVAYRSYDLNDINIAGYGVLPENPENIPETTLEYTTEDGAAVTVTGTMPEDAELRVSPVSEETLAEILAEVGSDTPVFAYDITIVDSEGNEWQPDELGAKVSITGLTLPEDKSVEVAHIPEEGAIEAVASELTEDGVEFTAPGFSVYVGYTVDFSYEGLAFSIVGDTGVYLSEVFAELEIPRNASEVESAVFSDPELVSVEQTEGDWLLTSLAPFTSEETLTLTFADGKVVTVAVTDAQYTYTKIASWSEISYGDNVIFENIRHSGKYLTATATSSGRLALTSGQANAAVWTLTTGTISGRRYLQNAATGEYLFVGSGSAAMTSTVSACLASNAYVTTEVVWQMTTDEVQWLNDYGNKGTEAAGYNSYTDSGTWWRMYKVEATGTDDSGSGGTGESESGETDGTQTEYWVKCTDNLEAGETYMIVSSTDYALGVSSSQAVQAGQVSFTRAGTTSDGKTYYSVSGAGADDHYQFNLTANGSNWNLKCANSTNSNYILYISSDPTLKVKTANYTASVFTRSGETWTIRRQSSSSTKSLTFDGTTFSASATSSSPVTIYKKITVAGSTTNQLSVKKTLTETTSLVTADTAFTFKLKASATDYSGATDISGVGYKIYNADNTVASTGTLTDGSFSLKAGQTARFELSESDTRNYFVSEVIPSDDTTIQGVTAKVNDASAAVVTSGTERYVPVTYSSKKCAVEFINEPVPDAPYLELTLKNSGIGDGTVTDSTEFTFTVKNSDGDAVSYTEYRYVDASGNTIGDAVAYKSGNPFISMHNGQTVRISGLESGTYTIEEALGGCDIYQVTATVDDAAATVTRNTDTASVTAAFSKRQTVVFTNRLDEAYKVTFDFRDGNKETRITEDDGTIPGTWPVKSRYGKTFSYWSTVRDDASTKVTESSSYVFTENTTLYANWTDTATGITAEADATLTKELRESTAYIDAENYENFFDIDLAATLPTSSIETLVLIFDLSSSMDNQCMYCGKKHGGALGLDSDCSNGQTVTYTGYDGTSHQETACNNFVQRLSTVQTEAKKFIETLQTKLGAGNNCHVSIVGFNVGGFVLLEDANLATSEGKTAILNTIGSLKDYTQKNTALSSGMYQGYLRLNALNQKYNVDPSNSCVILLSDGVPTSIDSSYPSQYANASSAYTVNGKSSSFYVGPDAVANATSPFFVSEWQSIWSTYGSNYRWNVSNVSASNFSIYQLMAPPYIAEQIRGTGSKLYTISLGQNMDKGTANTGTAYGYVAGLGLDNIQYLSSFSDAVAFVNTAADLNAFYSNLIEAFTTVVSDAHITDPMSDNVEFIEFTAATGGVDISISTDGYTVYDCDTVLAQYDPATRTIKWDPEKDGTLSYKVRLKNEASGFKDWDASSNTADYITNGETYITFRRVENGVASDPITKNVDVPYVHGWLGELMFTKYGGTANDITAKALPNAQFTLHHDPEKCTVCQNVKERDRALISDFVVTSSINGAVSFTGIPSGHTYTMSETVTPTGYQKAVDYTVTVAYGDVTVTSVEDDGGYWTTINGSRLFNLRTGGYVLPETGGKGTPKFTFGGLLLIAGACVYGYTMRRRRRKGVE